MILKAGKLPSKMWLAYAARLPCAIQDCIAPVQAHHFPVKGMGGARHRDDWVIPLCERHHGDCQAYRISAEEQWRMVHQVRSMFLEQATPEELSEYLLQLITWRESRGEVVVPW